MERKLRRSRHRTVKIPEGYAYAGIENGFNGCTIRVCFSKIEVGE